MGIKYTTTFHSKANKNFPNWNFWFENIPSGNPAFKFCSPFTEILRSQKVAFGTYAIKVLKNEMRNLRKAARPPGNGKSGNL
jgi:hypothetical protein